MQTCFKTRTVQKALESLLSTTFEDLRELRSLLMQNREENSMLASRFEESEQKHSIELEKSHSENLTMRKKLEEMQSKQNDYERDIGEQTSLLANHLQSMRLSSEQYEQVVYQDIRLREALQDSINTKEEQLLKAEIKISQKDFQIQEAQQKCSQLTDELHHVNDLLQAAQNEITERTNTVTSLQVTVSKLELEKRSLKEMVKKLEEEYANSMTHYEEALHTLKSKTADSLLELILMVSESNELVKCFEQTEVNLKMSLIKTELEIESVKGREKDLSQRITELKNEELAKSHQLNELSTLIENYKIENDKLKIEVKNGAKAFKELEEAYKTLDTTLMQTLQKHEELKENLASLQMRCKEQETTLAMENIKAAEQTAYVDKLVKKVEGLENEEVKLRAKLQETKKQAEFKNTKVEALESQLQERLRLVEELEDKVRINDSEKEEIQNSARENLELVARKDAENAQLTERLQLAEAERMAAVKRNDEIRAELLYAMEQQQQEMDKLLRLKDRELEGLRSNLATQQNDSEKNAKRTEKKIAESGTQIEKLIKQLKECTQEKRELSKQLNMKTQRMNKLEKENVQKANILQENTETLASLREELDNLRQNKKELDEKVSAQEMELQKLKKIEQEFESFRHQVIENSPPASTQLPVEIETFVQQTPKSPLLSQKLNHLNLLKTPQNTPKGILKRPGSECKRRRVLLVSPARSPTPPPRAETADYDVIDLDSEPEPQSRPITPKIRRTPLVGGRMPLQTRNSNLRKTPGSHTKGPADVKRREEISTEGASWFDSDPIFGLTTEN
uniref:Uncharacterized protein n=2 Tax=Schistocephalus solidus TaxID=70667 RepID=A0A0X3NVT6_SCHSO